MNRGSPLAASERKALELHLSAPDTCVRNEMNTTRIEVPVTLPAPHFDDESTIATARQVEPIARARVTEGWRKLRTALPLLLAATLCGALGAATVNYYQRSNIPMSSSQQLPANSAAAETQTQSPSFVIAASTDVSGGKSKEADTVEAQDSADKTDEQPEKTEKTANEGRRDDDKKSDKAVTKADQKKPDVDVAKLTRKRRVQSADEETRPAANRSGAGRIADIFSGPNP